ncbi:hypothetical protein [Vibrio alginolyticus]|uniref:hypothetical protein n=1 Tax=Vibrio alginolyticus TaxID=663 RepID=UPI00215E8985|nr:hypothetical protein [Vibrio alginolyticus]EJL6794113.1 hypothetical protein [Vibrio alginolyticus]MCS0162094.1 hypothetical protein [Vibrio alginolyticus]MCS0210222.1 hypothetical protein [Vibrio alginolyticus]
MVMNELDKSLESIEAHMGSCFKLHLINEGRLTRNQEKNSDYSYAVSGIDSGLEPLTRDEREQKFIRLAVGNVRNALFEHSVAIKYLVCDQLNYCANKNHEGIGIALTTLDSLIIKSIGYPVPILMIATWAIKSNFFDNLCECK